MIEVLHRTEAKGAAALALLWLSQKADESDLVTVSAREVAEARNGLGQ